MMRFDFHTHTKASHDAFTSSQELLESCLLKNIEIIAVTEHDKSPALDNKDFIKEGIHLIKGCEFTTNKGVHIIGLFLDDFSIKDNSKEGIVSFIKSQDGIIIMPHPYKLETGYLSVYGEDSLIDKFHFIELINGGIRKEFHYQDIMAIAKSHGLLMIASSDSHKCNQVGLCVTEIINSLSFSTSEELKKKLIALKQDEIRLLMDKSLIKLEGRRHNKIQKTSIYQELITKLPYLLKRIIKKISYKFSNNRSSKPANFEIFNLPSAND